MTYYAIDLDQARIAHEANSMCEFDPRREEGDYRAQVDEAYLFADKQAERYPHQAAKARALADKFAYRFAEWLNEGYRIEAMCPSILVSGGGNFPVKKKERQNARRDAHMKEYQRIMDIKRRISTVGTGGIQAGEADAIERLEAKAQRLEENHGEMKRANAYYRKHGTLRGYDGDLDGLRANLDFDASGNEVPFAPWALANNRANIKRTRERIEQLKREKDAPKQDREATVNGEPCTVVENAELMRLQLVFDGKPDEETRDMLKHAGFRWSPRNGAWQRQLTDNARRALKGLEG